MHVQMLHFLSAVAAGVDDMPVAVRDALLAHQLRGQQQHAPHQLGVLRPHLDQAGQMQAEIQERDERGEAVQFRTWAVERKVVVLSHGYAELAYEEGWSSDWRRSLRVSAARSAVICWAT